MSDFFFKKDDFTELQEAIAFISNTCIATVHNRKAHEMIFQALDRLENALYRYQPPSITESKE
jgi:hypothetical protein